MWFGNQKVEFNKMLRRAELSAFIAQQQPTVVVMEACYSSHHWGRTFEAMGHTVQLLLAQFVKPFVRGHKSTSAWKTGEGPYMSWTFTRVPESPQIFPYAYIFVADILELSYYLFCYKN